MKAEQRYLSMIRRWFWLLVLAALASGLTTYLLVKDQPIIYEAKVRLIIGPGIDTPDPDLNALRAGGQLMQTYAELSMTGPFLQSIIDTLNLSMTPLMLSEIMEVTTNQETQILSIAVRHQNPERALAIANLAADTLVQMSPSGPDSTSSQIKDQMRLQAKQVEELIASSEEKIKQLEADLQALTQVENQGVVILQTNNYLEQQKLIIDQLSQERGRLSDALSALTVLYDTLQKTTTNQVKIVEPAVVAAPVRSWLILQVLIGAVAGLALAVASVLSFEYFDDTIRSPGELSRLSDVPILGVIARHKPLRETSADHLVAMALPDSRSAESYRWLATKLLFGGENPKYKSVLIGSLGSRSSMKDGETAANLAVTLAQAGCHVALIDADIHQSAITTIFGINGKSGLTNALVEKTDQVDLISLDRVPNLFVLPSGTEESQPFELLSSSHFLDLVESLHENVDIVIIATSPLPSYADSLVLASHVDGVVLVARDGEVHQQSASQVVENLRGLDADLIGVVFDSNKSNLLSNLYHRTKSNLSLLVEGIREARRDEIHSLERQTFVPPASEPEEGDLGEAHSLSILSNKKARVKSEALPIQTSKIG
ncbi:MAG: polysaccharide biosynthesis tyrosine autokinase [Anaerolineales bacterium]|jgi:capsular exopolysaccharide synthesis family protein